MSTRLWRITSALSVGAAQWCPGRQGWSYGFSFESPAESADRVAYSPSGFPVIRYVQPALSAERVGVKAGDVIREINGHLLSPHRVNEFLEEADRLARARIQPITLGIEAGEGVRQINVFATAICPVHLAIVDHSGINAVTNGTDVTVTSGMLEFLHGDEELAWIMAHEIGHVVLDHSQSARLEEALDMMLRATMVQGPGVNKPTRIERETQADLVAAHILAAAGFNLKQARGALERFTAVYERNPEVFRSSTHPIPPERLVAFDRAVADIQAKEIRGDSGSPNVRGVVVP